MPTLVFCCCAGCGVNGVGSAPGTGGVRHWDTMTGAVTIDAATMDSRPSYKYTTAAGARLDCLKTLAGSPTVGVARFYVQFDTSLPSANCKIFSFRTASSFCDVWFNSADSKIYARGGGVNGATGVTVAANTRYRIDCKGDVSTGTRTMDVQVDGVACGQGSAAVAAGTITSFNMGINTDTTTANGTLYISDVAISQTAGDYPLGAGKGDALFPSADGTHSFNAAGDFKYENVTNVATSATDTWSHVNSVLDTTIGNFLAVVTASNTEYLEWDFEDAPGDVSTINGLQVTMASHSSATSANKQTLRLNDGGTLSDVCTDLDQSQTTICYHSKQYTVAPSSSAAWTTAKINALKARWNSSYGTVDESPVPFVDGVVLELDYVPTAGGGINVTPGLASGTWTGFSPTIALPQNVTPGVGQGTWTGLAPLVQIGQRVTPGVAQPTWTGFAPTVFASDLKNVQPGVGQGIWTGFAPTVVATNSPICTPGVAQGTWTGFAPTVVATNNQFVVPGAGAATWAGLAPTVFASDVKNAIPGVAQGTWTGFAPTVVAGAGLTCIPGTGVVTWTGFAPTVTPTANQFVTPGVAVGQWTGYAPTVLATNHINVTPGTAVAVWSGFSPHTTETVRALVVAE